MYSEDRLSGGRVTAPKHRTKAGSKNADEEYEKRNGTRLAYQRLSKYYQLEVGQASWGAPQLLSKGKHGSGHSTSRRFAHPYCPSALEDLETQEQVVVPPSTVAD